MDRRTSLTLKHRLRGLAVRVVLRLKSDEAAQSVVPRPINRLAATASNAEGWCYVIGRVRGLRAGALEIWLDQWPGTEKPVFSFCYRGAHADVVKRVATAARRFRTSAMRRGRVDLSADDVVRMPSPLRRHEFNQTVLELYSNHDCYYGVYLSAPQVGRRNAAVVAHRIASFFARMASAVTAHVGHSAIDLDDYPAIENRRAVAAHLRRERSKRLALQTKNRDGFTCRVCGLNFEHRFGSQFRGIAQAHHLAPLGRTTRSRRSTVDDLITVCPNCHCLLHRMSGVPRDWIILRRLLLRRRSL